MIQATDLTKHYGTRVAVDGITFSIPPGKVTGFLGPNGAGKSTTMRMVLGLDRPTGGAVTVNGMRYEKLPAPLREVGALLDAKALHGGRTAYNHLTVLAKANGIPKRRVDEMVDLVGLGAVARKRSGGFSLGMGQRLGIAAALLGDPAVVMFDEPVNGLDPEGILWIRTLMKSLAREGRTVFVSSHLMSEMALTADHLLVIGRGRILADQSMADFIDQNSVSFVRIRSPYADFLLPLLTAQGWQVDPQPDQSLHVQGATAAEVGDVAGDANLRLHELTVVHSSLEDAFMRLTADSVEYHAGTNVSGGLLDAAGGSTFAPEAAQPSTSASASAASAAPSPTPPESSPPPTWQMPAGTERPWPNAPAAPPPWAEKAHSTPGPAGSAGSGSSGSSGSSGGSSSPTSEGTTPGADS
ncbi:MAG TPA: ATP-binding cassette domain-containing protein [Actinocrinis sp.]|nr:ATP-binding cassette domain-containing protein [Actinocrinis sp.]